MSRAQGPHIRVTIDEVVLRGVPPERAREVLSDIEATLEVHARRAASGGTFGIDLDGDRGSDLAGLGTGRSESSRRLPDLRRGEVSGLGVDVADAVWSQLVRPGSAPRSDPPDRAKGTQR